MDATTWKAIEVSSKIMNSHGTWVGLFTLAVGLLVGNGWQLWIQERLKSRFRKELFGKMETGKKINDALACLLIDLDCERATVFQYHNGNQNALGVHFDRCSNTHECVQVGASPQRIWTGSGRRLLIFAAWCLPGKEHENENPVE